MKQKCSARSKVTIALLNCEINTLKLSQGKRRQGKPQTTKRLQHYKRTPKPFGKKSQIEQSRSTNNTYQLRNLSYSLSLLVFLSWLTGNEKANHLLLHKKKATTFDIRIPTEQLSTAITEPEVQKALPSFRELFTATAWNKALQTSKLLIHIGNITSQYLHLSHTQLSRNRT